MNQQKENINVINEEARESVHGMIPEDVGYMKRVLELAERGVGRTAPNPMVGAVLVKAGRIIGEGWHQCFGHAHAEVEAIRSANEDLKGATLYVNLEPCCHYGKTPPCTDLILQSKIERVVIGTSDPNPMVAGMGISLLRSAGLQVVIGMLEQECRNLNEVFFYYITKRRPFVVLKAAASLDGKIAAYTGKSKWITGEAARAEVHRLRSRYGTVMVGVDTVIQDNPDLTCRMVEGNNPVRVILDSRLRIPLDSRVLYGQEDAKTIIACTEDFDKKKGEQLVALGVKLLPCMSRDEQVDLADLMEKLAGISVDSVLLEGGGTLNAGAIFQGIVSKLMLYMAPKIIGGKEAKTFVEGVGSESPDLAESFQISSVDMVGQDVRIIAYPRSRENQ